MLGLARLAEGDLGGAEVLLTAARNAAQEQGAVPWIHRTDAALAALADRTS